MGSQYAFGPKEDDSIIKHRLLTRVSVTRGEPPMRRLVKKLAALAAEAAKEDGYEAEGGEDDADDTAKDSQNAGPRAASEREGASLEASAEDGPSTHGAPSATDEVPQKAMAECEKAARAFLLELAAFEQPLIKASAVMASNERDQQQFRELQLELLQQIDAVRSGCDDRFSVQPWNRAVLALCSCGTVQSWIKANGTGQTWCSASLAQCSLSTVFL